MPRGTHGDPNFTTRVERPILTNVTIPDGVLRISTAAFADNHLTNVIIPDGMIHIAGGAFANNRLTSVTIPDSVTYINHADFFSLGSSRVNVPGAFANNPQLTSITIGNGIDSLHENVFAGSLRNVSRISIGANVNLLGNSEVVWRMFRTAYEANGARAGVYTLRDGSWNWQPR